MNYIKVLLIGMMMFCSCSQFACKGIDDKDFVQQQPEAELPVKEGYILDFHDEFDEPYLNPWKWLTKYFPHSTSPNSEGVNATFTINNGVLDLSITEQTKRFFPDDKTNFRVSSIQTFEKDKLHPGTGNWTSVDKYNGYATKYGYFEMRAKLPGCGGGGHCAWWLIGCQDDADQNGDNFTESAEIDIIEPLFSNLKNSHPKIHPWTDTNIRDWNQVVSNEGDLTNEFHIYAMDWTPEGLKFYFDGNLIAETTESPNYRMCMFFSIYASDDPKYWSGQDNGVYPKTFSIDYVRVWKLDESQTANHKVLSDSK